MNPMEALQMFSQLQSNPNPMATMQQLFGNDPRFQQAMKMAEGRSPQELQQVVMNLAQTRGIDPRMVQGLMQQMGLKP